MTLYAVSWETCDMIFHAFPHAIMTLIAYLRTSFSCIIMQMYNANVYLFQYMLYLQVTPSKL